MKTYSFSLFALAMLIATADAQPTTLTGVVSDAMCGAHHMMKGASPAQCTRACVKQGSDFALVVGDKLYTLQGDKTELDKFAGQTVTVKGELSGTTLKVSSLAAAKGKSTP